MSKTCKLPILTANAPKPVGPYSQAIKAGNTLYVSGCIGIDKNTNKLVSGGVAEELKKSMENLQAVLKAANCDYSNGRKGRN